MLRLTLNILLMILTLSCKKESKSILSVDKSKIKIPLREYFLPDYSFAIRVYGDELYFLDRDKNAMCKYDLITSEMDCYTYPSDGPEAYRRITGFSIINDEQILLSLSGQSMYGITNAHGQQLGFLDYAYNLGESYTSYSPLNSRVNVEVLKLGEKFFIPQQLYRNPNDLQGQVVSKSLLYCVVPSSDTIYPLHFTYPRNFFIPDVKPKNLYAAKMDSKLLIHFEGLDSIYVFDGEKEKIDIKIGGVSNFIDKNQDSYDISDRGYKWMAENGFYKSIVTDSETNAFVRIVKHPAPENRPVEYNIEYEIRYPLRFSIQLFKNYELIGEYPFEGGKFCVENCFIYDNALYMSTNTPYSNNVSEDTLVFKPILSID